MLLDGLQLEGDRMKAPSMDDAAVAGCGICTDDNVERREKVPVSVRFELNVTTTAISSERRRHEVCRLVLERR